MLLGLPECRFVFLLLSQYKTFYGDRVPAEITIYGKPESGFNIIYKLEPRSQPLYARAQWRHADYVRQAVQDGSVSQLNMEKSALTKRLMLAMKASLSDSSGGADEPTSGPRKGKGKEASLPGSHGERVSQRQDQAKERERPRTRPAKA